MIKFKDTVDGWMDEISDGLEFRRAFGLEAKWSRLEAMYLNLDGSGAEIGPNVVNEMADALASRLNVARPVIGISPSKLDVRSVQSYPILQSLDSWLMDELDIPSFMNDVALHGYLWGRGLVKFGYDSEFGFDDAFDLGAYDDPMGLTLTQFAKNGKRLEYGAARPGMPWMLPVLPHDFVVPWGTVYLHHAPWAAHRIIRHIDLLKADPKYEKTRDLQPDMSMADFVDSYKHVQTAYRGGRKGPAWARGAVSRKTEFVELWEIHNKINGKMITISSQAIHRNQPDALQVDGLPFDSLTFVQHPRSFWTTPQAWYINFHQLEQCDIASQASKQRRINSLKFLIQEGAMEVSELEKALSPDVGVAAYVKQGFDPRTVLAPVPQGTNIPLWQESDFSMRNARSAIGFSRNQMGEFDTSSRRTATEASLVSRGSDFRTDRRQEAVARLYIRSFRKLNQIIFTFWKKPRLIQVGPDKWPTFTGKEIEAEYSYRLDFGSDRPKDPESRRMMAVQTYMLFRQDPFVDQKALRMYLARNFADVEFDMLFPEESLSAGLSVQMSQMLGQTGALPQGQGPQSGGQMQQM